MELEKIALLLEESLDPQKNKKAEIALMQQEKTSGYSIALLQIVTMEQLSPMIRLSAALYFKNLIKRSWVDEEGNYKLPSTEVDAIKKGLVGIMISMPPNIRSQLGDAVGIIADSDFWERWDTLVDDLVSRLTTDNFAANNGVLQVAHSIFKRWRPLYRSDTLFTEINHVLGKFGEPLLRLLQTTDALIEQSKGNQPVLRELFATLNLIIKLMHDLSCQDLPPIFEDHLAVITQLLQKYLTFDPTLLPDGDSDEAGSTEFVKSGVLELMTLWVQKYEDAVGVYVEAFIGSSWNLLATTGLESKYDILVSRALQFLTSVTRIPQHAQVFNNEETLDQIIQRVILPNVSLRESDLELFEDEPIEFIRRDLEGSDNDTRRRAATDFLRALVSQFEKLVTDTVLKYVNHYLEDYSFSPSENWRSKDTAVYLYSSIAAKGTVTASQGVKTLNPLVNIIDFFKRNISADMVSQDAVEPIMKVDAIKYLYTFRGLLGTALWRDALPLLVKHLASSNYVVYTYAAISIERALALQDESRRTIVERQTVLPLVDDLLKNLFRLIEKDITHDQAQAATKVQENEFLIRCIMRVLIVVGEDITPYIGVCLNNLVAITNIISMNPSNPRFCYYHFEAIGALVRFTASSQLQLLENSLYPPFATILQQDVQDFVPYVLQLFAALLEANPVGSLPAHYNSLVEPILKVEMWLSKGNVPALVRLLNAIIPRASQYLAANNQIEPILGIFKQLLLKGPEIYAFEILESVLTTFPSTALAPFYRLIMQELLTRLDKKGTPAYISRFAKFYHFVSANDDKGLGTDFYVRIAEEVLAGIFTTIYLTFILPETPKLARPLDRKMAAISLTKSLVSSHAFTETYAKKGWGLTCNTLLELLVNPPVPPTTEDIIVDHDVDDMGFGVGFTQLSTIKKPLRDPFPEITNVKSWVKDTFNAANVHDHGKFAAFAKARLSPEAQAAFNQYLPL